MNANIFALHFYKKKKPKSAGSLLSALKKQPEPKKCFTGSLDR